MRYDSILNFTRTVLHELNIHTFVDDLPLKWDDKYDMQLRNNLFNSRIFEDSTFFISNKDFFVPNTISFLTDSFYCEYIGLLLPETDPVKGLLIGPFSTDIFTTGRIKELCNCLSPSKDAYELLGRYYSTIPSGISENWLKALLRSLASELWETPENYAAKYFKNEQPFPTEYGKVPVQNSPEILKVIEDRYESENAIMKFISQGNWTLAEKYLNENPALVLNQRIPDTLRDTKNYMIIANTLFRKAAQFGHVHPMYLDELSAKFAAKIEESVSTRKTQELYREMIKKYCLLVQSYSVRNYSPTMQKIINYIFTNLANDLSLNTVAQALSLNASYLSTRFKKETGTTLTSYVNNKRIEQSLYFFNTTALPIQDIANMCGISDVNYFTRIFKKKMQMTPREYRAMIQGNS